MQDIYPIYFSGIVEGREAIIAGVQDALLRVRFSWHTQGQMIAGKLKRSVNALPWRSNRRGAIAVRYGGRTGALLKRESERLSLPTEAYTVGQLMCELYGRGDCWKNALDDSQLNCMVNGRQASLFDRIKPGEEICFSAPEV